MLSTGLSFQLPILQLLLGVLGLIKWRVMISSWRWVILISCITSAILTPSTDPITMILLSAALLSLFLIGVLLVAIAEGFRPKIL